MHKCVRLTDGNATLALTMNASESVLTYIIDGVASEFPLAGHRVLIGRQKGCDLCFPFNEEVSRLHASLIASGEGWLIEDVTSRSGTFVNGERVMSAQLLHDGDEIRIGVLKLVFRAKKHGMDTIDVGDGLRIDQLQEEAGLTESAEDIPVVIARASSAAAVPAKPDSDGTAVVSSRPVVNYYQLLGLENFDADTGKIRRLATDRIREIRELGNNASEEDRAAVNALSDALISLTSGDSKRRYDQQLAHQLGIDVEIIGEHVVPIWRPDMWQIVLLLILAVALVVAIAWWGIPWATRFFTEILNDLRQSSQMGT